jgi:polyhydroxyalkanoate synthesis regulator phasin
MPDAWRAYLEMALGLTEAPRKKAQKVAGELVSRGGATATQLQGLVEDLMQTGMANREALTNIVRYVVDRALGVVGLATAEEVSELNTRVRDLEKKLREARAATGSPFPAATPSVVAKKAVAKKAVAKKAPPVPAQPAPVTAAPAPTKAAPVKKVVAKKTVAKKAAPADDVLTESIGDELTSAERDALRAAVSPAVTAAPVKKTAPAKATKAAPVKKVAKAAAKKAPAKKAAPGTETPAGA